MAETEDVAELLFFDTFSHEVDTDINLDLVQFPKPVYITQVRIIPLGARVQADFPGGVRLGATNPSKFDIEFFVNDLGMPGASTFENLGQLKYNQNDCIHLECTQDKIPTDGLVLRGWYSTITLAVYGILTNSLNEPIASPPPPPCEPVNTEELCAIAGVAGGEARDGGLPDETIKEGWKEPLPGEMPHAHKSSVANDFEREDFEYGISRGEHFHHHSGDERDRHLRKTSRSSERSASSRNRTHSESNEREYMRGRVVERERDRDKLNRDWSRSPEYTRRARRKRSERSRSDAEEPHKWPRTPPACIDSPTRPRSPDNIEYMDDEEVDDARYKLKSRVYIRSSNESLGNGGQEGLEDDDGIAGEQYEDILSDDELIGDNDSEQAAADEFEMEIEAAAAAAGAAIEQFDAFTMPLAHYEADLNRQHHKELENLRLLFKKFEIQTKCESAQSFKSINTSVEERESFVYLGEQLINQLSYLAQQLRRRNFVLQQFFHSDARHLEQAYGVLQTALDFEAACAQPQPTFKIRHMKVGAKLAELLGSSADLLEYLVNCKHYEPFKVILSLYNQNYMALSIQLMLLKAVYALLDTKVGLRHFLNAEVNGYQLLLELLQQSHLTRTKYALQALLKKLNLYEALECVRENCTKLFVLCNYCPTSHAELFQLIEQAFEQLLDALGVNALSYQQPKRHLPFSKKFEIVADPAAQCSYANALQSYFKQHALGEALLLLLSNAAELPHTLLQCTLDLLHAMLQTHVGVDYLVDDCFETTQMLVAVLLGIDELPEEPATDITADEKAPLKKEEPKAELTEVEAVQSEKMEKKIDETADVPATAASSAPAEVPPPAAKKARKATHLHRLQRLGVELAYKVQTRYHLDAIVCTASGHDYDAVKLATHLHSLHSQTCNSPGRQHTVDVLGMNNNSQIFMDLIKKEQRLQAQRQLSSPGTKYKSPVLSYAVDMVDCCVRYCENLDYLIKHGVQILDLAKNHDTFEPSVSAVLQEMSVYLRPLEGVNVFAYDDITQLVEVITRSMDYITTCPGDLIMGLRILRHLAIGPAYKAFKGADTVQLKHRFVALQFYGADGMQTLMQVLEKLCVYFEQPGLHAPALMTLQGLHCCQIILPTLQILRAMLTFAIQCRDTEFKDLTAIDHLMKTYFLMHYFPAASQAAGEVALAKQEIIQMLLAYTQPNEQYDESLNKSLWTQMIREVLKNIDGPSSFIPGLKLLSELLPLPLPIPLPRTTILAEAQAQRLITERKLWSAHLHPQSAQIAKLIEMLAPSTFPQLSDLIVKVCLQLADLAPNMTLLVSKTVIDLLCAEWSASTTGFAPTPHLARLLLFLSRLTVYPPLKSSALSILSGKLWEIFQSVLSNGEITPLVLKSQISIHCILESFLDADISLISPQSTSTPELNLASALPPKDLVPRIVEALLTNLFNVDVTSEVSALAVRNLVILTEHDITFYYLSQQLKQRANDFQQWLQKIVELNETGPFNSNIKSLLLLLRALTQIESHSAHSRTLPLRTLKLSPSELAALIGLQKEANGPNLLQRIHCIIVQKREYSSEALLADIDHLSTQMTAALQDADTEENGVPNCAQEPTLPQAESIVMQYVARPIFTAYDARTSQQKISSSWLDTPSLDALTATDFETQFERVACDLTELAATCLPAETNLSSDCKRLLHLSASPQSNRERTPTAPCFRTRRVEVEPSTGRPEKKLYITPVRGRGFARAPPSRGDIFRSRPPNTSRPPSLHVDDFLALETCGAQPTGPTGYNKIPPLMRGSRVGRNRGSRISSAAAYRKTKILRTSSPSTWNEGGSPHYRTATSEPHFGSESHYSSAGHFSGGRARGRSSRPRPYIR